MTQQNEAERRLAVADTLTPVTGEQGVYKTLQEAESVKRWAEDEESAMFLVRVLAKRNAGKIVFTTLADAHDGNFTIQGLVAPQNDMSLESIQDFKSTVHIGDVLSIYGFLSYSNTGERTLMVRGYKIASKCINPFPKMVRDDQGKFSHVLQDETIHHDPTLHLLLSPAHRENVIQRSRIVSRVRGYYSAEGYTEVETPILSHNEGGAEARNFQTRSEALNTTLNLRIATELYLKRLIIGGVGNVFELGKNFRNEGIDRTHSPEFTSLEAYAIGENYEDMLLGFERLMDRLIPDSIWAWNRLDFFEALSKALGVDVDSTTPTSEVIRYAHALGAEVPDSASVEDVFDTLVIPTFADDALTVISDYPRESTPLAADHETLPGVCQKWDAYAGTMEIATGYTENTNARQIAELMPEDPGFIHDMGYGLPPLAGIGIGIDRIVMAVCGLSDIRDTLHTPHATA